MCYLKPNRDLLLEGNNPVMVEDLKKKFVITDYDLSSVELEPTQTVVELCVQTLL